MQYRRRFLETVVEAAVERFGAVVVTGPRQAGKTSLLHHVAQRLFPGGVQTVSFDTPSEIDAFRRDPELFFANHPGVLLLDEVQHVPDIFPYLKREVDRASGAFRFFVSGSQHFELMKGVSESMAGRAAILDLWPFCARETRERIHGGPQDVLALLENPDRLDALRGREFAANDVDDVLPLMLSGGYPPSALSGGDALWLESYRRTYIERDVRQISAVHDLGRFDRFMVLLAGRSGTVINKSELSNSLDVDNKTIDNWLDILMASYQLLRLPPYFANASKRVVKRPKYHFADPGLGLLLQGIRDGTGLQGAPHFGHLFESFVVIEIRKAYAHAGRLWHAFFWRSARGRECDLVLQIGQRLIPVEIKHASRLRPRDTAGIDAFMQMYGEQAPTGILVSLHPEVCQVTERVWNLPLGLILNGCGAE